MDVFSTLSQKSKILLVASSLFLITFSLGLLMFGNNFLSHESSFLEQARHGARADMLYSIPEGGEH